jgi:hypothetical protein
MESSVDANGVVTRNYAVLRLEETNTQSGCDCTLTYRQLPVVEHKHPENLHGFEYRAFNQPPSHNGRS